MFTYFGFTKANPFANPYEFKAAFNDVNNLKPNSPVRIAGVEVGKVTKVEPIDGRQGAAVVTMEIEGQGPADPRGRGAEDPPAHLPRGQLLRGPQARLAVAPTSSTTATTIPVTQTAAPVQFGDLLTALQTRHPRATSRRSCASTRRASTSGGAEGFNQAIKYWEPAYRNSSLANDATLGQEPDRDLQRVLKGQQKTFARRSSRDERSLKDLVTNFNVTAGALRARGRGARGLDPGAARHAAGRPPGARRRSTTRCRRCARSRATRCRASARRTTTLAASLPVHHPGAPAHVRGRAARHGAECCARRSPTLVAFNRTSIPFLRENRALSACTNNVLVPFMQSQDPEPRDGQRG